MPSTADGGKNSILRGGSDRILHITHICTTRDKAWCAGYHAIPNGARVFVTALARAEQVPFESSVERRIDLFAGLDHFVLSFSCSPCGVFRWIAARTLTTKGTKV